MKNERLRLAAKNMTDAIRFTMGKCKPINKTIKDNKYPLEATSDSWSLGLISVMVVIVTIRRLDAFINIPDPIGKH